jgi:hypothetical protein
MTLGCFITSTGQQYTEQLRHSATTYLFSICRFWDQRFPRRRELKLRNCGTYHRLVLYFSEKSFPSMHTIERRKRYGYLERRSAGKPTGSYSYVLTPGQVLPSPYPQNCSPFCFLLRPEEGGSRFLWNVGTFLPHYTAPHKIKPRFYICKDLLPVLLS